ncbi:MAG: hypothetical protein RIF32_20005 [Leptospirales bacterium]|jgi:hypothetical protein
MKTIGNTFTRYKKSFLAAVLAASMLQCSALTESDDDDDNLATLLAAVVASQCSLGGVNFNAVGPACNVSGASGTGTLTAVQTQTSFVSMLVSFQLLAANGSISFVAGLNPAQGAVTQNNGGELLITSTASKKPQDAGAGAAGAGTTAQTWCMEIHVDENPMHAMLDQTATCTAKLATATTYENDADGPGQNGGLWGFVLNNATITGITTNNRKIFTE